MFFPIAGSICNDTFSIYTTLYWTLGLLAFPAGMRFPYSGGGIVEWIENQGDMACFQQNWIRILKEEDRSDFAFLLWNKNLSMADYCSFMLLLLHPQCLKGEKVLCVKNYVHMKYCIGLLRRSSSTSLLVPLLIHAYNKFMSTNLSH